MTMTDLSDEYGPVLSEPDLLVPIAKPAPTVATGLPREVKVLVLVLQDRRGKKAYERMLNDGWTVDSTTPRTLSRAVTVTFSRVKLSRRDRRFISGKAARR